jgi:hypothetical protein
MVARMPVFSSRFALASVMAAALCLGARTVHAQAAPFANWFSSWPIGFGGDPAAGQSANNYGNFSNARYNFSNGWFVGSEGGGLGLAMNSFSQDSAFGSLSYQGTQFGYKFQNGGLPVTVYAGFDTLKYNTGIGSPFAPFDNVSSTLPAYSAHAGVEFQPTSNISLSLGVGFTQQTGGINSLALPGSSAFSVNGLR